ncbi:Leucine-rich repeat domain superfamily [Sesbania bispinosa]|nr:Leucine-rich repeat domain superfamily [Sesbania bispinosa]
MASQDIILKILSYVETLDAVRYSLVCRAWRHYWASLPVLNFNSNSFTSCSAFVTFVGRVLHDRQRVSLELCRFWLDIPGPYSSDDDSGDDVSVDVDVEGLEMVVMIVIRYALELNVKYLSLLYPSAIEEEEWDAIFSCQSLAYLELYRVLYIFGNFIRYSNTTLTKLHLVRCQCTFSLYVDDYDDSCDPFKNSCDPFKNFCDPFKNLLNLKELLISECELPSCILKISCPYLTKFTLSKMKDRYADPKHDFELCTPKLKFFSLIDSPIDHSFSLPPSLPSLEVELDIVPSRVLDEQSFFNSLLHFFGIIGEAKSLTLSLRTIQILSLIPAHLRLASPFTVMNILKVKLPHGAPSIIMPADVIAFLLSGAPTRAFVVRFFKADSQAGAWERIDS